MGDDKPTCFIVMPISVPEHRLEEYGGHKDHFKLVCEYIHCAAVEKAGFLPIPPAADTTVNINAEIVRQLCEADHCLIDMSAWNPNVHLELGIRTALNKSITLLKDDKTEEPPFDVKTIGYCDYSSNLRPQALKASVQAICERLERDKAIRKEGNPIWKYYGIEMSAVPATVKGEDALAAKFQNALEELRSEVLASRRTSAAALNVETSEGPWTKENVTLLGALHKFLESISETSVVATGLTHNSIGFKIDSDISDPDEEKLSRLLNSFFLEHTVKEISVDAPLHRYFYVLQDDGKWVLYRLPRRHL
ncbi:hypothetical protein KQI84_01215 [bacterium]|nr:hypothetical protein [bacterium]